MSDEKVTFVVKGSEQVYKFSKIERGFTYGSPIAENGVARKGRPNKFPTESVVMSAPVTETVPVIEERPAVIEKTVEPTNHVEEERIKGENFLKLD